MSLQRKSKWNRKKYGVAYKFDAVEETRRRTDLFWDELSLPKHKPTNRKPKPSKPKGSHNTVKVKLKAKAYRQAEERDEGYCVVCMGMRGIKVNANSHHHIIKQSTRYRPEYIQRMENVALVCNDDHTEIHNPKKGKSEIQAYLESWQQRYYPEYSAMMRELAKVTGCRDQWLIERWNAKNLVVGWVI